jgi:hypothetical protein
MGEQAHSIEDRLVRKSDLDDAKGDLRREMRLWIAVWVGAGTLAGNLLATAVTGDVSAPARTALSIIGLS